MPTDTIDPDIHPPVRLPDGSIATVRSIGVGDEQGEWVIPTIVNGKPVENDEAVRLWRAGKNKPIGGPFNSIEEATDFGRKFHLSEARRLGLDPTSMQGTQDSHQIDFEPEQTIDFEPERTYGPRDAIQPPTLTAGNLTSQPSEFSAGYPNAPEDWQLTGAMIPALEQAPEALATALETGGRSIINAPETIRYWLAKALKPITGVEPEYRPPLQPGQSIIPEPSSTGGPTLFAHLLGPDADAALGAFQDDLARQIANTATPGTALAVAIPGGIGLTAGREAGTMAGKTLGAYFAGQIGAQLPPAAIQAFDVLRDPNADAATKGRTVASVGGPAILAGLLIKGISEKAAKPTEPPIARPGVSEPPPMPETPPTVTQTPEKPIEVTPDMLQGIQSEMAKRQIEQHATTTSAMVDELLQSAIKDQEKPAEGTLAQNIGRMVMWQEHIGRLMLDDAGRPVIQTAKGDVEIPAPAHYDAAPLGMKVMRRWAKIPESELNPKQANPNTAAAITPQEPAPATEQPAAVIQDINPDAGSVIQSVLNVARMPKAPLNLRYGALEALPTAKRMLSGYIQRIEESGATDAQTQPFYDKLSDLEAFENRYLDVVTTPADAPKLRRRATTQDILGKSQPIPAVTEPVKGAPEINQPIAFEPETAPELPGPTPSADELLEMTPEQYVDWKKAAQYGPDSPGKIAANIAPEDLPALTAQRDALREQSKASITTATDDASMMKGMTENLKAQTLNEIIEAKGEANAIPERSAATVPVEEPPADSGKVGEGVPGPEEPAAAQVQFEPEQTAPATAPESAKVKRGWQVTSGGRDVFNADLTLENAKEAAVKSAMESSLSYSKLLAAYHRFRRSLSGKMYDPSVIASRPWEMLDASSGVMNAKSQMFKTLETLENAVFKESKLPRNEPSGRFRGGTGINWDEVNPSEIIGMGGAVPGEFEGKGGAGADIYGIAQRIREERAKAGQTGEVQPGKGIAPADSVERGRQLIDEGQNPEAALSDFEGGNGLTADKMALVRAHGEQLALAARRIEEKFGTDSPEYRMAWKALSDWDARTKPMQTEWHKIGQAQQGETDIDTGTFTGLQRAHRDATGRDFTPAQAEAAQRIAGNVAKATTAADAAKAKVLDQVKTAEVPEQSKALWKRAKEYIEAGETDFDDIRHKLATEFGMSVAEVTKALAQPKSIRTITDEMYSRMSAQRRLVQGAKNWLKAQTYPGWYRFIRQVPRIFFIDKIFGHGTVGMITHAGLNIFNPMAWKTYWPNFFRQYRLLISTAYHERMMQDLVRDPLYVKARRAGLANDPTRYQDDYNSTFANFFHKLGLGGNRGFDSLKLFRQARFDQEWNRLPASLQTADMAKLLADAINHATGTVKMPFREWTNWVFFAPQLEGSRWAWMLGDPLKAAKTLADWKNESPEARQFALSQVKEKAAIAGTYFGLLALNQGLLSATDSDQKINFTDTRRGDFLAFKAAGHNIGLVGPLLGMVRLFANLLHASSASRTKYENLGGTRAEEFGRISEQYLRGKLSPFASFGMDLASQADFEGRPLPWSNDIPPKYQIRRFYEEGHRQGVGGYSTAEYLTEKFLPIPVEDAIKEVWTDFGIDDSTRKRWLNALLTAVIVGGTGARYSEDSHWEQREEAIQFTPESK